MSNLDFDFVTRRDLSHEDWYVPHGGTGHVGLRKGTRLKALAYDILHPTRLCHVTDYAIIWVSKNCQLTNS